MRLHRPAGFVEDGRNGGGDFLGGQRGTFGQLAHLIGNDGKTAPLLAGPGRLDGRIEGQQVGLVGNFADDPDDAGNLLRTLAQRLDQHGRFGDVGGDTLQFVHGAIHDIASSGGDLLGLFGNLGCLVGVVGHVRDADRQLLDRGRNTGRRG
jgi:hypothetical protein